MWKQFRSGTDEQRFELPAVLRDAWRCRLLDKAKLAVGVDICPDVFACSDGGKNFLHHMNLVFARDNRIDSRLGLCRISRVGNHDPIAMPEKWQKGTELAFPFRPCCRYVVLHNISFLVEHSHGDAADQPQIPGV